MTTQTEDRIPAQAVIDNQEPTLDEVRDIFSGSEEYFRSFHHDCENVDDYYYGRNEVPAPEGFEPVRTAQARSIIKVASDHVDVNHAAISVPLASPRAKARAERLQKFYQGVWLNIREPVKRQAVMHAFAYGVGWMKTIWDSDRWPNAPKVDAYKNDEDYRAALSDFMEERNIAFPFVVENINPQRLVWDTSRIGPRWAIEFYDMAPRDLRWRYPLWDGRLQNNGLVSWMEYWDEKYYMFIAGDTVVESGEHGYGFFPYVPIQPANSLDWDDRPPHERYQSLLAGVFDLLDEHARLTTAYSAIVRNTAWRTLDFVGPEHLAEKARDNYEIFGGLNVVPSGVDVKASPMVQVPPDLLQELSIIETQIEQATFPNVIRGARPRGVSSGFGVSVLAGMGRLVFQGVADGAARAIEICNQHFAKLVENKARGRVTVHARAEIHNFDQSIGPDDIRGYVENIVTLKAEAPEEREREALLAIRLYQGLPGFSLIEAMKRAGVQNPLEMLTDRFAEDLTLSPNVRAQAEQMVSQRVNLLGQAAQLLGGDTGGMNLGNQFVPGMGQLQEPGQQGIQQQRIETNAEAGAYPEGMGGLDLLGAAVGGAPGTAQNLPGGGQV